MKVFRELELRGAQAKLSQLVETIEGLLADGWMRDFDQESKVSPAATSEMYCFSCTKNLGREAASLWLAYRDQNTLYVSNIIPTETKRLDFDQYNSVLREFYDKFAQVAAEQIGMDHQLTPATKQIEDWVSEETATKLKVFSASANKSTGSSHPLDEQRWFGFLIAAHSEATTLDAGKLRRWLIEDEGWPEDVAYDLSVEYEFARSLLAFYDENRK
jgi:hypothetical protein